MNWKRVPVPGVRAPRSAASLDQDSVTERDAPDYHLVSLRSDDVRRALASFAGCAELIESGDLSDDQCHLNGWLRRERSEVGLARLTATFPP